MKGGNQQSPTQAPVPKPTGAASPWESVGNGDFGADNLGGMPFCADDGEQGLAGDITVFNRTVGVQLILMRTT
jgi:hypothetical protein